MAPFTVTKELVAEANDVLLRTLLEKLLEAEARQSGIPLAAIAVGGNQTAADGGVDGSIEWEGDPEPTGWLPRRAIFFQSKAEVMAAARLKKEIRPKDVVRPIFDELAAKQGAYIVFSTDDPSKSAYDERISAMTEMLADVADGDAVLLDFCGADKIARWTNSHRGVAIWLLGELGRPLGGWRPYGDWSAPGAHAQPYLFDDTARVEIDGVTMSIRDGLIAMRKLLSAPGGAVRLIGPSGMGKTRLAEALFDDRFDPATALVSSLAIYGDAGLELAVGPALVAEQLAVSSIAAIIVVDCPPSAFNRQTGCMK